jgi:hypothetical protein
VAFGYGDVNGLQRELDTMMDGSAVWPVKNKWANYNINPDAARLPSSQEFPNRKAALATHNQKKAGNKGPVEHAEIEENWGT